MSRRAGDSTTFILIPLISVALNFWRGEDLELECFI